MTKSLMAAVDEAGHGTSALAASRSACEAARLTRISLRQDGRASARTRVFRLTPIETSPEFRAWPVPAGRSSGGLARCDNERRLSQRDSAVRLKRSRDAGRLRDYEAV